MGRNGSHLFKALLQCLLLFLCIFNHDLLINGATQCPKERLYGPYCQYINHLFDASVSAFDGTSWHKGSDCNSLSSQQKNITFHFTNPVSLYWIRVEVRNKSSPNDLSFSLKSIRSQTIPRQHEKKYVTGNVVDIWFDLTNNVSYVSLQASVKSVCDVYISKGKLITNNYKEMASKTKNPQNCIDNDKQTVCYATGRSSPAFWRLDIPDPAYIFKYIIRTDTRHAQKAAGNLVTFLGENNEVIWSRRDKERTGKKYYIGQVSLKDVRRFEFAVDKYKSGTSAIVLSLAEIWLLGDYICTGPFYGKRCDKLCNCADDSERCFPVTGSCSSGCAPGFQGMDCMDRCDSFTFGFLCANRCSGCVDVCDSVTGRCSKCKSGFLGSWCNETCPRGTFGSQCKSCPKRCKEFCNPFTGHCNGSCSPGWQGETCQEHCDDYLWGRECANRCSDYCARSGKCNPMSGYCKEGCKGIARGPRCEFSFSYYFTMFAPFLIVLLTSTLFGTCMVYLTRKQQNRPKQEEEDEEESESSKDESTENEGKSTETESKSTETESKSTETESKSTE